jgi:hypothetical protein
MRREAHFFVALGGVLALAVPALAGPVPFPTDDLLPPTGWYEGPAAPVIQYVIGVQGRSPALGGFAASWPPPAPGGPDVRSFGATIRLEYSMDGGASWIPGTAPVNVTTSITNQGSGNYLLEVLAMDVDLGGGALIRESPTRASLGSINIQGGGGGGYMIDSFFDVFTELSLDGGQTWSPSVAAERMTLMPEPGSLALLGLGALIIRRRRR